MIEYSTGTPKEVGMYACRVPDWDEPKLFIDEFYLWDGTRWCYPGSDQIVRRAVPFFIGPLRRKMPALAAPTIEDLFK